MKYHNHNHSRIRSLLMVAFMLLSVIAFSVASVRPAAAITPTASDFCYDCTMQCLNEAFYVQDECYRQNGGYFDRSLDQPCHDRYVQYFNSCVSLFCNPMGCAVKKLPRTLPGDN